MSDAITNQKLDLITEFRRLAGAMIELANKAEMAVEMSQTLNITQAEIDGTEGVSSILDGSAHAGLSYAKISNLIGSLDALATSVDGTGNPTSHYGVHGVNYRSMR